MAELPEVPKEETEEGAREQPGEQGRHELHPEPNLEIPVDIRQRNMSTHPQCQGENGIQRDSILKIGMKLYRKRMKGRRKINGKGLDEWRFVVDV